MTTQNTYSRNQVLTFSVPSVFVALLEDDALEGNYSISYALTKALADHFRIDPSTLPPPRRRKAKYAPHIAAAQARHEIKIKPMAESFEEFDNDPLRPIEQYNIALGPNFRWKRGGPDYDTIVTDPVTGKIIEMSFKPGGPLEDHQRKRILELKNKYFPVTRY